jgi:hypothetical protein
MVRDLEESTELMATSRVVAALAGHVPSAEQLKFSDAEPPPAGDSVSPGDELLVLDADASQQAAVNAALHGRNAVILGPPGTGKSQTIANIIAGSAAAGRTVLFVAEKRAAIEAVTDRLASVQLDGRVRPAQAAGAPTGRRRPVGHDAAARCASGAAASRAFTPRPRKAQRTGQHTRANDELRRVSVERFTFRGAEPPTR